MTEVSKDDQVGKAVTAWRNEQRERMQPWWKNLWRWLQS